MGVVYGIGLPTLLPSWVPWHFSCCPDKLVYAAGTGSNNRSNLFEKMDCNDKQLHQGWFPILIFIMMFWPCESRKEDVLFVATIKMPILAGSPVWWLGPSISVDQKNMMVPLDILPKQTKIGWWFQTWILFSISYMGCHPSHWRTPSFFQMVKLHHQQETRRCLKFCSLCDQP